MMVALAPAKTWATASRATLPRSFGKVGTDPESLVCISSLFRGCFAPKPSEPKSLAILRHQDTGCYALVLKELPQLLSGQHAVVHGLHVAGHDGAAGNCLVDLEDVLLAHDDGAKTNDLSIAAVQDNNIGRVLPEALLDVRVPDSIPGEIQGSLIGVPEDHSAYSPQSVADLLHGLVAAMLARGLDKGDAVKIGIRR